MRISPLRSLKDLPLAPHSSGGEKEGEVSGAEVRECFVAQEKQQTRSIGEAPSQAASAPCFWIFLGARKAGILGKELFQGFASISFSLTIVPPTDHEWKRIADKGDRSQGHEFRRP